MKKLLNFSEEEKKLIARKCFPLNAKAEDINYGIMLAEQLGLNPLTREIMFVERRAKVGGQWISKVEPLVSRDGFLSIAHKSGQFDGMETNVSVQKVPKLIKGQWQATDDLVSTTNVWRKDMSHPITISVAFSEYAQYDKQGSLTLFWRTKPKTMLSKVAESQALRRAFNISGIYVPEEVFEDLEVAETVARDTEQPQVQPDPKPKEEPKPVEKPTKVEPESKVETESESKPEPDPEPEPKTKPETEDFLTLKAIGVEIKEENGFYAATGKTYQNKALLKKYGFVWDSASKRWAKPVLKVA